MQRASVTLKIATSLDGRIALSNGVSQWITGRKSRLRVHEMRAQHDAVLVGVGTVLADDPLLTARTVPLPSKQPVRIVVDSRLRTPPHSRITQSARAGDVIIAHGDEADTSGAKYPSGVKLWSVGGADGVVSPLELLRRARAEGINTVFLEGGGKLAASFIVSGLVEEIAWFRAPIILGGDGIPAVAAMGLDKLENIPRWALASSEVIENDVLEIWSALHFQD